MSVKLNCGAEHGQLTQQTRALLCMCKPSASLSSITAPSPLMAFEADHTCKLAYLFVNDIFVVHEVLNGYEI